MWLFIATYPTGVAKSTVEAIQRNNMFSHSEVTTTFDILQDSRGRESLGEHFDFSCCYLFIEANHIHEGENGKKME